MTTNENPFRPNYIAVGDLVVDDATGEVMDWPREAGFEHPDRIAWLARQYQVALEQEKEWESTKRTYNRAMMRALGTMGEGTLTTEAGKVSRIPDGESRRAPAKNVEKAADAELLTADEIYDLLVYAARDLDVEAVLDWIGKRGESERKLLEAVLIDKAPRRGYVRFYPKRLPAPERKPVVEEAVSA